VISSGIDWTSGSYEELCRRHRWRIPARLNIGFACSDAHAGSGRLALIEVVDGGGRREHRFDEIADASSRLAAAFLAMGVERGDRVAVFLPQRLECALAHLAAFKLGAISVPLSPLFRAEALRHRLKASGAKVVVTDSDHLPALREVSEALPSLRVLSADDDLHRAIEQHAPMPCVDTASDEPAMLCFTSGTTGLPRGALHAHRFLPGRLTGFELIHRLESGPDRDRPFWTPADWAWIGGLVDCVLTPWLLGCPVLAFRRHGFDPARAFELIRRERVRSLFLPPTALHRLRSADAPPLDVLSVHTAGEPLPAETYRWAAGVFGTVFELYGMTEMGATIGCCPFTPVKPGSMGRPFPGHEVALLDPAGRAVVGEGEGEIAVRRGDPGMFLGYFDDEPATRARFRGDYLVTGDVARRDADGYLHYLGRNDDVFNASGYRIGPAEIEDVLCTHAAVAEAAVVGEPDAERGHVVKAFVVLRSGHAAGLELSDDIARFVKQRLAAYEYPRKVVFVRELPRTETGKVRRSELRSPDAEQRYGIFASPEPR
jgi:acetyl-CoA synthetase